MRKRIFALLLGLSILLLTGGCGKGNTPASGKDNYNVDDYIQLGQYKGVKVTVTKLDVTDDDVNKAIQSDLQAIATQKDVTGRAIQNGDIVNIDYEGLKDGVAFSGGTATGYTLTIGSNTFIPGFETGLIDHNIGEKVALNLTFPADYGSADLAGKAVVFNVTINSIKESVLPELTDELVKSKFNYDTVDAYKQAKRDSLKTQNDQTMQNQKTNEVFTSIVSSSKISKLPQSLLDYYKNDLKNYYTKYAQQNGMDFAAFLTAQNMTQADFDTQADQYSQQMATQDLVIKAIIKAEKMTLSDAEYNAGVDKILKNYGYASKDELLKSGVTEDQLKENILMQKAMDFVTGQAVEG